MQATGAGPYTRLAGYILVGGASRRMGRDKALLPWGGRFLVDRIADLVKAAAGSVTLVGNVARYQDLGYPVTADLYPNFGPVGGIVTALVHSTAEWNLVTACDMPGLEPELLDSLLRVARETEGDAVVPVTPDGRQHPLCAVYHKRSLQPLAEAVHTGVHKLQVAIRVLDVKHMPMPEVAWSYNLNSPADWEAYLLREKDGGV